MDPRLKNAIPASILGPLTTTFISSFTEYLDARIVTSVTDVNYLQLVCSREIDEEYYYLVELSDTRLQQINGGGMNVIYAFQKPEKGLIYIAHFDSENSIQKLWWLDPEVIEIKWPISDSIKIDFKPIEKSTPIDIVQYSKSRGRFVIEIHLEANGLKDNMRLWSIKNFLIPYSELIKTVFLDRNDSISPNELEKKINLGFSKIEIKCLDAYMEGDCNESLYSTNIGLENLNNFLYLLNADNEKEIIKYLDCFQNKKVIPQYDSILWQIIRNKADFKTQYATPKGHYMKASINKRSATKIKKILDDKLPPDSYEQKVVGVLTRLDFQTSSTPRFALISSSDNTPYIGVIDSSLDKDFNEMALNFRGQEYDCRLQVTFTPESKLKSSNYEYKLMHISLV
ncbi:MAG TPA: hypothetical protein DCL77_03405 [Prolixibacteraceae bacterium]|jgi:hypothetical protein|nr:hypothetical protein [Prolixibacteraceae bacterium]